MSPLDDAGELRDDVVKYEVAPGIPANPSSDETPEGEVVVEPEVRSGRRGEIVEEGSYRVLTDPEG